jgi:transposase-like protein
MADIRTKHSPEFKFKVALEAFRGDQTLAQLAAKYGLHPKEISSWKKVLVESKESIFEKNSVDKESDSKSEKIRNLELLVSKHKLMIKQCQENIKKLSLSKRIALIDPNNPHMTIAEQCYLYCVPPSTYYSNRSDQSK